MPPGIGNEQVYAFAGSPATTGSSITSSRTIRGCGTGRPPFVDNPRLRWRRILVPALAWLCALGQSDFVDSAYFGVLLGFVFLGAYWLSRYFWSGTICRRRGERRSRWFRRC